MTREPAPKGPAVLLDYALVHPGHWVEDAVYFEHLYWGRRQKLMGHDIGREIAHERKKRGLTVGQDWVRLASIRRAMVAMTTPSALTRDGGGPQHVQGCLEVLEREVVA
jgi:hypothetical protein